jgi:putative oxidoreductase
MSLYEKRVAFAILCLRLMMAFEFGFHLYFKFANGFQATFDSFVSRGYWGYWAYADMLGELVVVPCLLLGAYSRYWMVLMSPIMIGAIGVFLPKGLNFTFGGYELPMLWLFNMWLLVVLGDGRFAISLPKLPFDGRHPGTQISLGTNLSAKAA